MEGSIENKKILDYIYFFDKRQNLYVVDMRAIYDCDNELLPDLYARGLFYEPIFTGFRKGSVFEILKPGLLIAKKDILIEYEAFLREVLSDDNYVCNILSKTLNDFLWLYHEIINLENVSGLSNQHFEVLNKLMATARIKRYSPLVVLSQNPPSHLGIFYYGLYALYEKIISFDFFASHFAYLFDFYMAPSDWENELYAMRAIKTNPPQSVADQSFDKALIKSNNIEKSEKVSYYIAWIEEIRRVITQKILQVTRRSYIGKNKDSCYLISCNDLL